jgi:hypothetical protein
MKAEEQGHSTSPGPSLIVKVALSAWMMGVLVLYVLLYTPQPVLWLVENAGLRPSLENLQKQIRPFFQTEDFNRTMEPR